MAHRFFVLFLALAFFGLFFGCSLVEPVCGNGFCESFNGESEGDINSVFYCAGDCGVIKSNINSSNSSTVVSSPAGVGGAGQGLIEEAKTVEEAVGQEEAQELSAESLMEGLSVCGNGICEEGESMATCVYDCRDANECGDGRMDSGEMCEYDSQCVKGQKCLSCACTTPASVCGNYICEKGEVGICTQDCEYSSNTKNKAKYFPKEVFIVSDRNWQDVFSLVPVAAYRENGDLNKYPMLIYHDENGQNVQTINLTYVTLGFNLKDFEEALIEKSKYSITYTFSPSSVGTIGKDANIAVKVCPVGVKDINVGSIEIETWPSYLTLLTPRTITIDKDINKSCYTLPEAQKPVFRYTSFVPTGFDADSIIDFLNQYKPGRVTIVGRPPQELADLLIAPAPFGAGLSESSIKLITKNDYFSYWQDFNSIIAVASTDYKTALVASAFASITNQPLVFIDKINAANNCLIFSGKKVTIAGSLDADLVNMISGLAGKKTQLTFEELSEEFRKKSDAVGAIILNPFDQTIIAKNEFFTQKSGDPIQNLYTSASLAAPYLSATRRELIIPLDKITNTGKEIDAVIKTKAPFLLDAEYKDCNSDQPCMQGNVTHTTELKYGEGSFYLNYSNNLGGMENGSVSFGPLQSNFYYNNHNLVQVRFENKLGTKISSAQVRLWETDEYYQKLKVVGEVTVSGVDWWRDINFSWVPVPTNPLACIFAEAVGNGYMANTIIFCPNGFIDNGTTSSQQAITVSPEPEGEKSTSFMLAGFFYNCPSSNVNLIVFVNGSQVTSKMHPCLNDTSKILYADGYTKEYINVSSLPYLAEGDVVTFQFSPAKAYISAKLNLIATSTLNTTTRGYSKTVMNCNNLADSCAPRGLSTRQITEKYTDGTTQIQFNGLSQNKYANLILPVRTDYYCPSIEIYAGGNLLAREENISSDGKIIMVPPVPPYVLGENPLIEARIRQGYTKCNYVIDKAILIPVSNYEKTITLMGASNAIPFKEFDHMSQGYPINKTLDMVYYADIYGEDLVPDIGVGRILGLSVSDASTTIARSLFFDEMEKTNNIKLMTSPITTGDTYTLIRSGEWAQTFKEADYNAISITKTTVQALFYPGDWVNQDVAWYQDHGNESWAGLSSTQIPTLSNTIVINDACSTCAADTSPNSFCSTAMRKGATLHTGATGIEWSGSDFERQFGNNIFKEGMPAGMAFTKGYGLNYYLGRGYYSILGDPLFNYKPEKLLARELRR